VFDGLTKQRPRRWNKIDHRKIVALEFSISQAMSTEHSKAIKCAFVTTCKPDFLSLAFSPSKNLVVSLLCIAKVALASLLSKESPM